MIKILALLFCCLALASARRATRIRNGDNVSEADAKGKFGFVAYIASCKNGRCGACTASLIGPDKVLTAAHCLCGKENYQIQVYLQTTRAWRGRKATGRLIWINRNYICPNRGAPGTDIGMIKLDQRLPVKTVPVNCDRVAPGTEVTMIGFGRDERGGSGVLKYGTRRTQQCRNMPGAICVDATQGGKTMTFFGDSGGPLLMKKNGQYQVVGVVNGRRGNYLTWASTAAHCNDIKRRNYLTWASTAAH